MCGNSVEKCLAELEACAKAHPGVAKDVMQADSGALYPVDFMAFAVLHRSMALIRGFCAAIRSNNFTCAAPLVRLQLDNLLRFYALYIVKDPHDAVTNVFRGIPIRKQFDRDGAPMTDHNLVQSLAKNLPWVESVYRESSGFVHLSEKHMYHTQESIDRSTRSLVLKVSGEDVAIPDSARVEAARAMTEISLQVLKYICGWARTKDVAKLSSQSTGACQNKS
jgi:hypothetical protein